MQIICYLKVGMLKQKECIARAGIASGKKLPAKTLTNYAGLCWDCYYALPIHCQHCSILIYALHK